MGTYDTAGSRAAVLISAVAFGLIGISWSSAATTLEIEAAVRGTAIDAEYDGVFEDLNDATIGGEFATVTMGRVFGSFESERRAILEFDISGLPQGAAILSARLIMDFVSASNDRGAYFFYGYEGDGLLSFGDSDRTQMLVTAQSGAGFDVDADVTDFIQDLVDDGVEWAGILGLETVDEVNTNFIAGPREGRTLPTLVVEVPEPASWLVHATALVVLAALRRRGAGRPAQAARAGSSSPSFRWRSFRWRSP